MMEIKMWDTKDARQEGLSWTPVSSTDAGQVEAGLSQR